MKDTSPWIKLINLLSVLAAASFYTAVCLLFAFYAYVEFSKALFFHNYFDLFYAITGIIFLLLFLYESYRVLKKR